MKLSEAELKALLQRPGMAKVNPPATPSATSVQPSVALSTQLAPSPTTDESKLNKTETSFLRYLKALKPPWLGIQNITLKLGDDCRYTPDFTSINHLGQITFWETKGFMRDDARVKLQVAARQFRWAKFVLVKKSGLTWDFKTIKP